MRTIGKILVFIGIWSITASVTNAAMGFMADHKGSEVGATAPAPVSATNMASSVAYVKAYDCDAQSNTGTAWVVGKNLLATSAHVVVSGEKIIVGYGSSGKMYPQYARVVGFDVDTDVALLASETGTLPALDIHDAGYQAQIGQTYQSIGHPHSRPLEISPMTLEGDMPHGTRGTVYSMFGEVEPGDSGSPMLDGSGIVSGIVYGKSLDGTRAYVTPVADLQKLIQQAKANNWQTVANGECGEEIAF